jgi:DNA-binding LacI/PurR family transcriptional regulator
MPLYSIEDGTMATDEAITLPGGITQRQVADATGVSISTVSRTLAGHAQVSARTRSDVLRAIERLQRTAGETSGAPRRQMIALTHSHAVEGPPVRSLDIILEQVLGGAEAAARQAGYMLYTVQNSRLLRDESSNPELEDVRGVILAGGLVARPLVETIRGQGLPVVIIGGHLPDTNMPSVASNSLEGVRMAIAHLIGLGHRRIGLVNGPSDTYTSIEKKAGYLTALAEAGIAADPNLIRWHDGLSGFDVDDAIAMTGELLDLPERPTAIAFASDGMALAGIAACRARGLRVPTDISIVGFHDDPDAQMALPRLTTIHVSRFDWGAAAMRRMLHALVEPQLVADRLLLPTRLVVRESTAAPA